MYSYLSRELKQKTVGNVSFCSFKWTHDTRNALALYNISLQTGGQVSQSDKAQFVSSLSLK
jgi:hypothetical protein